MPDIVENPTKLDDATVQKLEEAFSMDCSVAEACLLANISRQTYFNWMASFPEMKERFDQLRQKPILKARMTVVHSLNNPDNAFRYLERKKKDEFAPRTELSGPEGVPLGYVHSGDLKQLNEGGTNAIQVDQTTEVPLLPEASPSKEVGKKVRDQDSTR